MYGRSLGSLTDFGSTGNKFLPPAFCQSAKDRDLKVVIPVFPRPLFLARSFFFMASHWALLTPSGMYSMLMEARLAAALATWDPEKEEVVEKAAAEEVTARTPTAMVETDFIMIVFSCGSSRCGE